MPLPSLLRAPACRIPNLRREEAETRKPPFPPHPTHPPLTTCGCFSSLHSWAVTAASPSARMAEQLPVTCRFSTSRRSTITLRLLGSGVCVGGRGRGDQELTRVLAHGACQPLAGIVAATMQAFDGGSHAPCTQALRI